MISLLCLAEKLFWNGWKRILKKIEICSFMLIASSKKKIIQNMILILALSNYKFERYLVPNIQFDLHEISDADERKWFWLDRHGAILLFY